MIISWAAAIAAREHLYAGSAAVRTRISAPVPLSEWHALATCLGKAGWKAPVRLQLCLLRKIVPERLPDLMDGTLLLIA
jgi:hypothetical protein